MTKIAILLTCYNRHQKTLHCLRSIYEAKLPDGLYFEIFLVDDASTDGTGDAVKLNYPKVKVLNGTGNLFWAGGMRFAWSEALKLNFDGYLLMNDDTILYPFAFTELLEVHYFSMNTFKQEGIYIGTTNDPQNFKFTYGGYRVKNKITGNSYPLLPDCKTIQSCDYSNGNILFVSKSVVQSIGILLGKYTHSLADYDYTIRAKRKGFPLLICPNYSGSCEIDHGNSWLSKESNLSDRIKYLKSPKHLAYFEYLSFVRDLFPLYWPLAVLKLWAKTLFPSLWDRYKR